MYFRVTTYSFDAARRDEFLALADTFRDELNAIDGLESVHSCEMDEGEGMIVSQYSSESAANDAQPQIQSIFGRMAPFMTSMPEVKGGEVIWSL
ncbi:MAG: antibiotic biosynthesis monooxygenase [Arenicellales bacterium]